MTRKPRHVRASDIHGLGRLAVDATIGLTNLVETLHHNISRAPGVLGTPTEQPMTGISGLVYRTIRGVTRLAGGGINAILARLGPLLEQDPSSTEREAVLAALNGVLGDHLAASGNPLAISMRLRQQGEPRGRILLLAHGLCMNDLQWLRKGHDHGAALAADASFTPVYLHYNSGAHVPDNGRAFAERIEALLSAWPVPVDELAIVGHSMGGLVTRSACHYGKLAGHGWLRHLRSIVFLGTPHHGAPLERGGNWVDAVLDASPYTAAFARLGKIRSAGITDLRYGNLLDGDWGQRDRFARSKDARVAVPLPGGVRCHAIAASLSKAPGDLGGRLVGDGLVPVDSALGRHADPARTLAIPESSRWIAYGTGHLDLLDRAEVYERIRRWLS